MSRSSPQRSHRCRCSSDWRAAPPRPPRSARAPRPEVPRPAGCDGGEPLPRRHQGQAAQYRHGPAPPPRHAGTSSCAPARVSPTSTPPRSAERASPEPGRSRNRPLALNRRVSVDVLSTGTARSTQRITPSPVCPTGSVRCLSCAPVGPASAASFEKQYGEGLWHVHTHPLGGIPEPAERAGRDLRDRLGDLRKAPARATVARRRDDAARSGERRRRAARRDSVAAALIVSSTLCSRL